MLIHYIYEDQVKLMLLALALTACAADRGRPDPCAQRVIVETQTPQPGVCVHLFGVGPAAANPCQRYATGCRYDDGACPSIIVWFADEQAALHYCASAGQEVVR